MARSNFYDKFFDSSQTSVCRPDEGLRFISSDLKSFIQNLALICMVFELFTSHVFKIPVTDVLKCEKIFHRMTIGLS